MRSTPTHTQHPGRRHGAPRWAVAAAAALVAVLALSACQTTSETGAPGDDAPPPPRTEDVVPSAHTTAAPSTDASAPAAATVMDVIERNSDFNDLRAALDDADLTGALREEGPFTVFAPTAQGFETLREPVRTVLRDQPDQAAELLLAHVVPGEWRTSDLDGEAELETLAGTTLRITTDTGGAVAVNELAEITQADIPAGNGVVHAIDGFIVPEQEEPSEGEN